jgi:hypothetical protein
VTEGSFRHSLQVSICIAGRLNKMPLHPHARQWQHGEGVDFEMGGLARDPCEKGGLLGSSSRSLATHLQRPRGQDGTPAAMRLVLHPNGIGSSLEVRFGSSSGCDRYPTALVGASGVRHWPQRGDRGRREERTRRGRQACVCRSRTQKPGAEGRDGLCAASCV